MNRKKKYEAPVIAVLVMEPAVMLVDSGGNKYKVTGQTGDSDYPLEYGGEGGGSMYDPD